MNTLKRNAMFYLAAAVSDFYVPWEAMVRTVDLPFENEYWILFTNKFSVK